MEWTAQRKQILIGVIIGVAIGIPLSILFANLLWLPLMAGVGALISLFCKRTPDISMEKEDTF